MQLLDADKLFVTIVYSIIPCIKSASRVCNYLINAIMKADIYAVKYMMQFHAYYNFHVAKSSVGAALNAGMLPGTVVVGRQDIAVTDAQALVVASPL